MKCICRHFAWHPSCPRHGKDKIVLAPAAHAPEQAFRLFTPERLAELRDYADHDLLDLMYPAELYHLLDFYELHHQ